MSNKLAWILILAWLSAGSAFAGGACAAYAVENSNAAAKGTTPPCDQFKIGNQVFGVINLLERNIQISEACRSKATGKLQCDAYEALKRASFKAIAGSLHGGMNPGSPICESLGGKVVIGELRRNKAEFSFCEFKDGSLVDSGTLQFYGRQNDAFNASQGK